MLEEPETVEEEKLIIICLKQIRLFTDYNVQYQVKIFMDYDKQIVAAFII